MAWGDKARGYDRSTAAALLGVAANASPDDVRAAYRVAVKASHPDTAPVSAIEPSIDELRRARDLLLEPAPDVNEGDESICKSCGGTGRIGVGFGTPCPVCRGNP